MRISTRTPSPNKLEIGRIVDVGFHHGGVHAHLAPGRQPVGLSQLHQPLVNLLDHLRAHGKTPTAHGLCIRRFAGADAGEVAVDQIGAHLALEHLVAPIARVLEDQKPQHHLGWCTSPAAAPALGMPPRQSLVHRCDNVLVREHRIGVLHPVFTKIAHFLGDQSVAEAELRPPHLNHAASSGPSMQPVPDEADHG